MKKFYLILAILGIFQAAFAQLRLPAFTPYVNYPMSSNEVLVTSGADSGPGTLREAINTINSGFMSGKIGFRAPNNTSLTVTISSPLPPINKYCIIDGHTNINSMGQILPGMTASQVFLSGMGTANTSLPIQFEEIASTCYLSQMQIYGFSGATITVTSEGNINNWRGSFALALKNANISYAMDNIRFNIPGGGIKYLNFPTMLPWGSASTKEIISPVNIDGTTQPGYSAGAPMLTLENGGPSSALILNANAMTQYSLIKGIQFKNNIGTALTILETPRSEISECVFVNNGIGVAINGSDYTSIKNSWFGCSKDNQTAQPNQKGISVTSHDVVIQNNIISGNVLGVWTSSFNAIRNLTIKGNKIGTNETGTLTIPNATGLDLDMLSTSLIKDNLISGNTQAAIRIGYNTSSLPKMLCTIRNNKIGTDISGTLPLPNLNGINFTHGKQECIIDSNIIAFNTGYALSTHVSTRLMNNSMYNNVTAIKNISSEVKILSRSGNSISGIASGPVQLFYDNRANASAQGKDFIAEVIPDQNGNWTYNGTLANPCDVTAIYYNTTDVHSSGFSKVTNIDWMPDTSYYCVGDTATLLASGYSDYTWSTGETTASIKVHAQGKVWVRDGLGCGISDTTYVKFIAKPTVNLGPDLDTCSSMTVQLNAGFFSGAKYYWNGSAFAGGQHLNVSSTNNFRVKVAIGNCINFDTVHVAFHTKPTVNLGKDTLICNTASVLLDAKNSGATYAWSSGETTRTITASAAGTYSVSCYFHPSCSRRDTVTIQTADCNIVSGTVYRDDNSSCVKDGAENPVASRLVVLTRNSDLVNYFVNTDATGFYSANLPIGTYTIRTTDANNPVFCPASGKYIVTVGSAVQSNRNFGVRFVANHDLSAGLAGPTAVRLNANILLNIQYSNKGNTPENGIVKLFIDPFLEYVSADVAASSVDVDTISWTFENLQPGEVRTIKATLHVPLNLSLMNTQLCHLVQVSTVQDETITENNRAVSCIRSTYPYDPNCKLVSPAGTTDQGYVSSLDTAFVYTIHFQNTGTDTAYNVVIEDTLSRHLNGATLETLASSAPYTYDISGNGLARWTFTNIMLADSNVNEPASHGFVQFRIHTNPGIAQGTRIENEALIYFDLAPAVVTDPAVITIKDLEPQSIFNTTPGTQLYPDRYVLLNAISDAALPLHYIVEGPAVIVNDSIKFTGTGTVNIRIVQEGDENYSAALSQSFSFDVIKGTPSLALNDIADQELSTQTIQLNATSNSSSTIQYTVVSGPASISGNIITFSGTGEVEVQAYQNANEYYNEATASETFIIAITNGLTDAFNADLEVYPNPVKDRCTIQLKNASNQNTIQIISSTGTIVATQTFAGDSYIVNMEAFNPGVYTIEISNEQGRLFRKLVVE